MRRSVFSVVAICALIALSIFSVRFFPAASAAFQGQNKHNTTMPIQHIVFIVKENHSFVNYFGLFPGADGTTTGKAKVNGVVKTIPLGPFQDKPPDYPHGWKQAQTTYDHGAMDLFNIGNCKTAPYPCYQEATSKDLPNFAVQRKPLSSPHCRMTGNGLGERTACQSFRGIGECP